MFKLVCISMQCRRQKRGSFLWIYGRIWKMLNEKFPELVQSRKLDFNDRCITVHRIMCLGRRQRWIYCRTSSYCSCRTSTYCSCRTGCHILPIEPCCPPRCSSRQSVRVSVECQNLSLIETLISITVSQSSMLLQWSTIQLQSSTIQLQWFTTFTLHQSSSRKITA